MEALKRAAEEQMRRRAPDLAPDSNKRQKTEAADGVDRFAYAAADALASGSRGFLVTCGFRRYACRVPWTLSLALQQPALQPPLPCTQAKAVLGWAVQLRGYPCIWYQYVTAQHVMCVAQGEDQHQGGYSAPAAAAARGHGHPACQGEGLLLDPWRCPAAATRHVQGVETAARG
jgi:hypothetical protein